MTSLWKSVSGKLPQSCRLAASHHHSFLSCRAYYRDPYWSLHPDKHMQHISTHLQQHTRVDQQSGNDELTITLMFENCRVIGDAHESPLLPLRGLCGTNQRVTQESIVFPKSKSLGKVKRELPTYLSVESPGPLTLPPGPRVVCGHVALRSPTAPNTSATVLFLPAGVSRYIGAFVTPSLLHRL